MEKYGRAAVESWWWEVWNEPDIGYWHGTVEEYQKLYDYAADGLKRALPTARIGGPHVTGPNGPRPQQFLKAFLEHCLHGTNYATGKPGSPLDYVGFHAKGAPRVAPEGFVRMSVRNQLQAIDNAFAIVGSFPELSRVPVVIGESDPEGCAACPMSTNPSNAYRNGTMYSSYTAEQLARTYELTDRHHVNLIGAVTWAFEFEEQPYFAGFRDLSTNGIDKPVLNVFRMLGRMKGDRVRAEGDNALTLDAILEHGVVDAPDVSALATADAHSVVRADLELPRRRSEGVRSRCNADGERSDGRVRDPHPLSDRRRSQQRVCGVAQDGITGIAQRVRARSTRADRTAGHPRRAWQSCSGRK